MQLVRSSVQMTGYLCLRHEASGVSVCAVKIPGYGRSILLRDWIVDVAEWRRMWQIPTEPPSSMILSQWLVGPSQKLPGRSLSKAQLYTQTQPHVTVLVGSYEDVHFADVDNTNHATQKENSRHQVYRTCSLLHVYGCGLRRRKCQSC